MPSKRKASPTSQNARAQRLKKDQRIQEDPPVRNVTEQEHTLPNNHGVEVPRARGVVATQSGVPNAPTKQGARKNMDSQATVKFGPPVHAVRQTRSQHRKAQETAQTSAGVTDGGAGVIPAMPYIPGDTNFETLTAATSKTKSTEGVPKAANPIDVADMDTSEEPPAPPPSKKKKKKKTKSKKSVDPPFSPSALAKEVTPQPPSSKHVHSTNNIESQAMIQSYEQGHSDSLHNANSIEYQVAVQPCEHGHSNSPQHADGGSPTAEQFHEHEHSTPPKCSSPTALVMSPGMEQLFQDDDSPAEESRPGTPVDLVLKYGARRVDHRPYIPSLDARSEDETDSDEELFDAGTFEQLFGQYSQVTNNTKSAFKNRGKYDDDDPLTIWLIDDDEQGPCDYMFKTSSGEMRYYSTFPRQDLSGVTELFTWYRPGGSDASWLPIPEGYAVPHQSVNQRAWAQRDFDAMATVAGLAENYEKMCESSDYNPSDVDESDSQSNMSNRKKTNRPPRGAKGRRRATRRRSKSPVRRAGRPSRVEIECCEALGKEMWERVEDLADRFGRDQQTIMVAAGLYLRSIRLQNIWNCWQTLWRIKFPEIVAQDKAWKRRCSAEYHAFMSAAEDDPELKKLKEEEILQELETKAKDPELVLNAVAQMNAVLSDSHKQCKTERFLRDIHVLKFVIYTGPKAQAAQKSGVVTGSPLVLDMIQNGNCRIQELMNMLTGMIKGYQINKEVDVFLDDNLQNSPLPDGPLVLAKAIPSKFKAVRKTKNGKQATGIDTEEAWIALNDASLEIYRKGARQTHLGLTSATNKIMIRTIIAAHLGEEYNHLRPYRAHTRGNFPWANWPVCAVANKLTIVDWPFSFWPAKSDTLDKSHYRQLATAYINDFDSGPKLVRWTEEQNTLDPVSFDYGNIPLVINTAGEPVVRLYQKNAKYLTAYAAAHPKGRGHSNSSFSSPRPEQFEGYPITDHEDINVVEKGGPHLYRIPESPEPSTFADPGQLHMDDIEEFTEDEMAEELTKSVVDINNENADVTMLSSPIPSPCPVRYPVREARDDVFDIPSATNASINGRLDYILPPPPARPRGDIAPTRPRDGVERMDHLRRQQRRITTPVNPDIFYRKNTQTSNVGRAPGVSADLLSRKVAPAVVSTLPRNDRAPSALLPRENHRAANTSSNKGHASPSLSDAYPQSSRNMPGSTNQSQHQHLPATDKAHARPQQSSRDVRVSSQRQGRPAMDNTRKQADLSMQEVYSQSSRHVRTTIHASTNQSRHEGPPAADITYSDPNQSSQDVYSRSSRDACTPINHREGQLVASNTQGHHHGNSSSRNVQSRLSSSVGAPANAMLHEVHGPIVNPILGGHVQLETRRRDNAARNSVMEPAHHQGMSAVPYPSQSAAHQVPPQARRAAYFSSDEDNVNRPPLLFTHRQSGNGMSRPASDFH